MSGVASVQHKFPFEIVPVEPEINAELLQYFHGEKTGFVQVGPEKYFFPYKYKEEAAGYYNFQARADDVWLVTFPRSGTTWTQELVWLLANKLDFKEAKRRLLAERFPFFEFPVFVHAEIKKQLLDENANKPGNIKFIEQFSRPGYEALSEIDEKSRRFIKTHFPFSLLPPSIMQQKCKIIYVAREVKDVAVSYYHLNRLFRTQGYVGDFERYWRYFEKGLNPWMPYHSHIREALAHQHLPNVLFLRYEDMLQNLADVIKQVADFLGSAPNAEEMHNLINHLNISNFRLNSSVNLHEMQDVGVLNKGEAGFVRAGGEKTETEFETQPALLQRANSWIAKKRYLIE